MKETASQRVEVVINELYNGNVARAARELEVDRSTVARYVSGEIEPTPQTLLLLSKLLGLDLTWLKNGPGLEIKYDPTASTGVYSRPVTTTPTSTVPNHDSLGFKGLFRQVQPFHNVADRFWFWINAPISDKQIAAGDFILIRTIKPRSVNEADFDQLFMLKRGERVVFDAAKESDMSSKTKIVGIALMIERDLAHM